MTTPTPGGPDTAHAASSPLLRTSVVASFSIILCAVICSAIIALNAKHNDSVSSAQAASVPTTGEATDAPAAPVGQTSTASADTTTGVYDNISPANLIRRYNDSAILTLDGWVGTPAQCKPEETISLAVYSEGGLVLLCYISPKEGTYGQTFFRAMWNGQFIESSDITKNLRNNNSDTPNWIAHTDSGDFQIYWDRIVVVQNGQVTGTYPNVNVHFNNGLMPFTYHLPVS